MPAIVRNGDSTTGICDIGQDCCPHGRSGTVTVVSGNVNCNGLGVHRLNDTGTTNCPHGGTFSSVAGSGSVYVNGQPVVRVGDATICTVCGKSGTHTSGSGNVIVGG